MTEVLPLSHRRLTALAAESGKKVYREVSDLIDAAFRASDLELPPEDGTEAAGNGNGTSKD